MGYENELSLFGEAGARVSRIVSRYSDALISAPVLKDHDLCGLSGCMKNLFGAIHNPNKMHPDNCDPYIADCFSLPEFSSRTRLFICDATLAQYHGGPGYKPAHAWKFAGVIVSSVAQDSPAARAGLRPGDLIVAVNNVEVQNAKQFNDLVAKLDPKRNVALLVRRGDQSTFVIIKPTDR